jgi:hypothetical protein
VALTKAQEKEVKRLQGLGFSETEATEMVLYDDDVEHGKATEYDLTEEQKKVARQYTAVDSKRKNPNYVFTKRERKPNETKRTIMKWLKVLFDGFELKGEVSSVNLSNIERQIDFECDGKQYSITLTEHRQKKQ